MAFLYESNEQGDKLMGINTSTARNGKPIFVSTATPSIYEVEKLLLPKFKLKCSTGSAFPWMGFVVAVV